MKYNCKASVNGGNLVRCEYDYVHFKGCVYNNPFNMVAIIKGVTTNVGDLIELTFDFLEKKNNTRDYIVEAIQDGVLYLKEIERIDEKMKEVTTKQSHSRLEMSDTIDEYGKRFTEVKVDVKFDIDGKPHTGKLVAMVSEYQIVEVEPIIEESK